MMNEKLKAIRTRVSIAAFLLMNLPMAVHATGGSGGGDPSAAVKAIIDVVVKIFPYIGSFFIVVGIVKLIQAFRTDQPDAQAGAAKDIVIGAVFLVFATFIWEPIRDVVLP